MINIEVLFPEVGNLYGDLGNIDYLRRVSDEINIIEDDLVSEPYFLNNTPDLIYMGTMTESSQVLVTEKLRPYTDRIKELIEKGVYFLFTGNAFEVFMERIEDKDSGVTECLGILPAYAKRDMMNRFNSLYLGTYEAEDVDITIVGYKSQFTHGYLTRDDVRPVFETRRGPGLDPELKGEGIRINNFMGTYIIGPVLVLNPLFTRKLLCELGLKDFRLPFEEDAMKAYEARVEEYSDPNRGFYY